MFLRKRMFFVSACLPLLTACASTDIFSAKADKPTRPHLVDFTTKAKEMMGKSSAGWILSGPMSQMMDTLGNFPMMAVVGHDVKSAQNCLWSDGKAFTGLSVIVQGNAFSKGLLGQPNPVSISVRPEPSKSVVSRGSGPFIMTGTYSYTATVPYITCDKMIEVEFDAPALKEGEGDYEVLVGPIDNSTSSITFKHPVSISESFSRLSDRSYDSRPSSNTANSSDQANSEPKTQYEIQQRQAEAERNRRY